MCVFSLLSSRLVRPSFYKVKIERYFTPSISINNNNNNNKSNTHDKCLSMGTIVRVIFFLSFLLYLTTTHILHIHI